VNGAIVFYFYDREFYPFWRYATKRRYRLTTRIPMNQGDVLLRKQHCGTAGCQYEQHARPMMSLTVRRECAPKGDPFQTNDGKMIFYPNWYSSGRLGLCGSGSRLLHLSPDRPSASPGRSRQPRVFVILIR